METVLKGNQEWGTKRIQWPTAPKKKEASSKRIREITGVDDEQSSRQDRGIRTIQKVEVLLQGEHPTERVEPQKDLRMIRVVLHR